jgi:hypothetical protein
MADDKFVGIQISPISFVDEGIDAVLDTLQQRVGVNVLMIGTVSWLGLKVGRSISHKLDGWPDHGVPEPSPLQGGAYVKTRPEYYRKTIIDDYENRDPLMAGFDVLEQVIPAARARGMQVYSELMEPFFKYAGHGSVNNVAVPNLAQLMEVDFMGRLGSEPSTSNKDYRMWIRSMIEDQVRSYDLDGLMWCNERKSPLDQLITGGAPGDFSPDAWEEADRRGIDVERVRIAFREVYDYFQAARAGTEFVDGAFVEFWRVLLAHPRGPPVGALLARAQQGPRPRALRDGQVVQPEPQVRAERLEPQPLQLHPQGAVALARTDHATPTGSSRSPTSTSRARSTSRSRPTSTRRSSAT